MDGVPRSLESLVTDLFLDGNLVHGFWLCATMDGLPGSCIKKTGKRRWGCFYVLRAFAPLLTSWS